MALVANTAKASTDTNEITSDAIDTTGANFIVIGIGFYNGTTPNPSVSDSKGNTWTALTNRASTIVSTRQYYCFAPTVGSGHTFTVSGVVSYPAIAVQAWSGIAASPADQENGATTSGSWATVSTGSVTPSQANTVLVASLAFEAGGGTTAINSGFTISNTIAYGTSEGVSLAYKILTSADATNPEWSSGGTNSGDGAAAITSFKY